MANIFVRSTTGDDANNGSTWALAKASLISATTIDANGDTIYVSKDHAESNTASTATLAFAGTAASPVRVICVDDTGDPVTPTVVANTATFATTGASSIAIPGCVSMYGITISCGTGAGVAHLTLGNSDQNHQVYDSCIIRMTAGSGSGFYLGSVAYGSKVSTRFLNCLFYFSGTGRGFSIRKADIRFIGGGLQSGTAAITTLVVAAIDSLNTVFKDFDLSLASSSLNLVYASSQAVGRIDFINCKLPSGWSGNVVAGAPTMPTFRVSMYNCDSGATNYKLWIETYAGKIQSNTAITKVSGASDNTTPISWRLETTANANEWVAPLITDDMAIWIDAINNTRTISVDIAHSGTILKDNDVWLEIDCLESSSSPLGTPKTDYRASGNILTANTSLLSQANSSAVWSGIVNPTVQKLEVTFTPRMKGFVYARVCLAKPSYVIFVDPEPIIT